MIVAYGFASAAALFLALSVSPLGFPGVHDLPRKALGELLHEGNELAVLLRGPIDESNEPGKPFPLIKSELDEWWQRVESLVKKHHAYLLPVLKSDEGIGEGLVIADRNVHGHRVSWWNHWLNQRLKQLEKVVLSG